MDRTIQYTLKLSKIHCYVTDELGADEVFLKMDGKKIWPTNEKYHSMKAEVADLNLQFKIEKGSRKTVEIWDYDLASANDLLGTVEIIADVPGGPFNADMHKADKGSAKYGLEYEVL